MHVCGVYEGRGARIKLKFQARLMKPLVDNKSEMNTLLWKATLIYLMLKLLQGNKFIFRIL